MKRARSFFFILGFAAVLGTALCQAPPQADRPQLYLLGDFLVDVSRSAEYEAALKELLSCLAQHSFPLLFDIYATNDGHYFVIYGLKDFSEVDRSGTRPGGTWPGGWGPKAFKPSIAASWSPSSSGSISSGISGPTSPSSRKMSA